MTESLGGRIRVRRLGKTDSLRDLIRSVVVALCLASSGIAHETDQYSVPVGRDFADLRYFLSEEVYDYLFAAVTKLNKQIAASLRDGEATAATARLQTAEAVATAVYAEVPLVINHVETLELRLGGPSMQRRFPGLIVVYRPPSWIYHHWLLILDPTKLARLITCGTLMANGTYFGTDKIIHLFHMGHMYFRAYDGARKGGASESEALRKVVDMGTGGHLLSEKSFLGILSSGVYSNGDLAANYAGLKFFRNLTESVALRGEMHPPLLVRDGELWRLNEHVRRDKDFLSDFISPHWDEVLNPSLFAFGMGPAIKEGIKVRCPDLLYWYRDESGRAPTRDGFLSRARELATFYGEDYGHKGDLDTMPSVWTICFPEAGSDEGKRALNEEMVVQANGSHSVSGQVAATNSLDGAAHEESDETDALGRDALWRAAYAGRLEEVGTLARNAESVNRTDVDGETPLHAAARSGNVAVVELLLENGARCDAKSVYGLTAMHLAARRGHKRIVEVLEKQGADANARDSFGCAPLHDAAGNGHSDVVAVLIEGGADVDARDALGTTPLHCAARRGAAAIVKCLLDAGAISGRANAVGHTALDEAQFSKDRATIELLRQHEDYEKIPSR